MDYLQRSSFFLTGAAPPDLQVRFQSGELHGGPARRHLPAGAAGCRNTTLAPCVSGITGLFVKSIVSRIKDGAREHGTVSVHEPGGCATHVLEPSGCPKVWTWCWCFPSWTGTVGCIVMVLLGRESCRVICLSARRCMIARKDAQALILSISVAADDQTVVLSLPQATATTTS